MSPNERLGRIRDRLHNDEVLVQGKTTLRHFRPDEVARISELRTSQYNTNTSIYPETLQADPGFFAIVFENEVLGFLYLYQPPDKLAKKALNKNKFTNPVEVSYAVDKTNPNRLKGLVAETLRRLPDLIESGEIDIEAIIGELRPGHILLIASVTHENLASQANLLNGGFRRTSNYPYNEKYPDKYPTFIREVPLPHHPRHVE